MSDASAWDQDIAVLAQIGAAFFRQATALEVRVPRTLAGEAVAAWNREEYEVPDDPAVRARAATLALIGSALEDRGREDGNDVIVKLDAWFVGEALTAAEASGLIGGR